MIQITSYAKYILTKVKKSYIPISI